MRIKALLGAAVLAAGAATSMAQSNVYSLNVVGYVNVTLPGTGTRYALIANPLNTTNNTLGSLIPAGQDGDQFFKYNGGYTAYTYDATIPGWTPDGNATLNPGEGGFYHNILTTPQTITFVGEVLQGSLTNPVPINAYAIRSSQVPQTGLLTTDLGFPGEDGDQAFTYNNGYTAYTFDVTVPGWTPSEPTIPVGSSFFTHKVSTSTQNKWIRNFTVQ